MSKLKNLIFATAFMSQFMISFAFAGQRTLNTDDLVKQFAIGPYGWTYDIMKDSIGNIYIITILQGGVYQLTKYDKDMNELYKKQGAGLLPLSKPNMIDIFGNLYLVKESTIDDGYNIYNIEVFTKYDSNGNSTMIKYKTNGGKYFFRIYATATDQSGNLYLAVNTGYNEQSIIKYDSAGNELWVTYAGDFTNQIAHILVDASGNILTSSCPMGILGITLSSYDENGLRLWYKQTNKFNGDDCEGSIKPVPDSQGNIYFAQSIHDFNGNYTAVTKFDNMGNVIWNREYPNSFGKLKLATDAADSLYLAGTKDATTLNPDFLLVKYDQYGNQSWSKTYDSKNPDYVVDFAVDPTGNAFISGYSELVTASERNFLTVKFDTQGNKVWTKNFGRSGYDDYPVGIELDSSGNLFVAGTTTNKRTVYSYLDLMRYK